MTSIITRDLLVGDVLNKYAALAAHFTQMGMHCLGCPASRGETIEQACETHGVDCDEFVAKLNADVQR